MCNVSIVVAAIFVSDLSFYVPMDVISDGIVESTGVMTTVHGSPGM